MSNALFILEVCQSLIAAFPELWKKANCSPPWKTANNLLFLRKQVTRFKCEGRDLRFKNLFFELNEEDQHPP